MSVKTINKIWVFGLILGLLAISLTIAPASASIGAVTLNDEEINVTNPVPITTITDYRDVGYSGVIRLPAYTSIDDKAIIEHYNAMYDNVGTSTETSNAQALCSCIIKPITINGTEVVVMGRNLDLPNSYAPAFVFDVNAPDRYRSINMGYSAYLRESYDQMAKTSTIDGTIYKKLVYLAFDVMNEKGLVIETNMRPSAAAVVLTGTNPGAELRIPAVLLPRIAADRCANISEVLELINHIDIYMATMPTVSWHYAFAMMDSTGRYGVLEFVNNKAVWHEKQPGHTNFWIDKTAYDATDLNCGLGRWAELMKGYYGYNSENDIRKAIEKLWYSQIYYKHADEISFDIVSELVGDSPETYISLIHYWLEKYNPTVSDIDKEVLQGFLEKYKEDNVPYWTNTYLNDPEKQRALYTIHNIFADTMNQLSLEEQKQSGYDEVSAISYVVNNKDLVYHVKFFEQDDIFHFGVPTENGSVTYPTTKVATPSATASPQPTQTPVSPFPVLGLLCALCGAIFLRKH